MNGCIIFIYICSIDKSATACEIAHLSLAYWEKK